MPASSHAIPRGNSEAFARLAPRRHTPARSRRREALLLAFLITALVAVRLPALLGWGLGYDEAKTLLGVSGYARPTWPTKPTPAGVAQAQFRGTESFRQIARDLGATDLHPPLYFWCLTVWRQAVGYSVEAARVLSLLFAVGTVLAFYLLLRAGKLEHPLIATAVYAFSAGALFAGNTIRGYALASLLLVLQALFAYLSRRALARDDAAARAAAHGAAMAVCFAGAFSTAYVTLFPGSAILVWYLLVTFRRSRLAAFGFPLLACALALSVWPVLSEQVSKSPDQTAGFFGIGNALISLAQSIVQVIFPLFSTRAINYALALAMAGLIGSAAWSLRRVRREENRQLWLLLAGIACAPSLGILALELIFRKHLSAPRFVDCAGPALAALLCYPISRLASPLRAVVVLLIAGLQIAGTYLQESGPDARDVVREIDTSSRPSRVLVIDAGYGRGYPGSIVYELDPRTPIVAFSAKTKIDDLLSSVQSYDDVWVLFSYDPPTARIREDLGNRLAASRRYRQVARTASEIHLRRADR